MATTYSIGQRISFDGVLCTVRYIGEVAAASGSWLGVEWDDSTRGKHDGSLKGVRYFTCLSASSTAASFVRPTRPADSPQSFLAALKGKYVEQVSPEDDTTTKKQIIISGKVAEEMGFDKIRNQIAQLGELKIVILDGLRIASATSNPSESINATCPKITQLDISRNVFTTMQPVVDICKGLPVLHKLAINGNRFNDVLGDSALRDSQSAFSNVVDLGIGDTLLTWPEICHVANGFPQLSILAAGANHLSIFPDVEFGALTTTLTTLNLEFNDVSSIDELSSLTQLNALRNLHLKGNNISTLSSPGKSAPIFTQALKYLDVSYNNITDWDFVDKVTTSFPGLNGLRISHNPIYTAQTNDTKGTTSEEAYMFIVARIGQLSALNFSPVTATDRNNAEMFYLSRIGKQIANVPEGAKQQVIDLHPRYAELCEEYGEPDIIRHEEVNPAFLEARLMSVSFQYEDKEEAAKIPKSFDIYAVKSIAGKLFNISPLKLSLVWETGEWDPVAGFYEDDGDSSDDDADENADKDSAPSKPEEQNTTQTGRWLKREVELRDGPRQLGYCVEGSDARIRVELVA